MSQFLFAKKKKDFIKVVVLIINIFGIEFLSFKNSLMEIADGLQASILPTKLSTIVLI